MTKRNLRTKGLFPLTVSSMKGSQSQNPRQGSRGRNHNRGSGGVLLTGLFHLVFNLLAYSTQGWHCPLELCPPTLIINQKLQQSLFTGWFCIDIFSTEDPSSQMTLVYVSTKLVSTVGQLKCQYDTTWACLEENLRNSKYQSCGHGELF